MSPRAPLVGRGCPPKEDEPRDNKGAGSAAPKGAPYGAALLGVAGAKPPPRQVVVGVLREAGNRSQASKGVGRMPRLREAKKDVASCDKPRVGANGR